MAGLEHDTEVDQKVQEADGDEFDKAKGELELWKSKVQAEEDANTRLILKKLEEEQEKKKAKKLMMELINKQDELQKEVHESSESVQNQMSEVRKRRMELTDKLKKSRTQLQEKRAETQRLQHKFKICVELPDTEVEFVKPKQDDDDDDASSDKPIKGQFCVCQEGALLLTGRQALITFEEEKVVSQILKTGRCSVPFEDHTLEVTPKRIRTEPLFQFEIQLCVSRSLLDVSEVVGSMAKERVEDRLELAFCRPSRGGAEVKSVEVDLRHGTARVAFVKPGVAEWFALRGEHQVNLDFQTTVKVAPVYEYQLQKFQSFCGTPKRTLLLDDIRDTGDEEEVQDQLEIHFQKPSNGGGEIEHTLYTSSRLQAVLSPDL